MSEKLLPCPFCGGAATVGANEYYDGANTFYIYCASCGVQQTTTKIRTDEAIAAWNRRAQPENSRQHALQTGVCPMCEDCPDGCPVEAPNDSRNKPENEPLTLDELRQMDGVPVYVVDAQGRGEWQFRINCGLEDDNEEWTADEDINWDRYGDLWRAYRAKPERSDT
jgi:Lar family restriction alleviation protein